MHCFTPVVLNRLLDGIIAMIQRIRILQVSVLILVMGMGGCAGPALYQASRFVPDDFLIPVRMESEAFVFRPLVVSDAEADYEAVMESRERLRRLFGGEWPADSFSLAQNKADLLLHEQAAAQRKAFTYTILSAGDLDVLGCLYIYPGEETDAEVLFWVRDSAYDTGVQPLVYAQVKHWMKSSWPFQSVKYVGSHDLSAG